MGVYEKIEAVAEVVMGGGPMPTGVLFERLREKAWKCTLTFNGGTTGLIQLAAETFGFAGTGETPEEAFDHAWKAFDEKISANAVEAGRRLDRIRSVA